MYCKFLNIWLKEKKLELLLSFEFSCDLSLSDGHVHKEKP